MTPAFVTIPAGSFLMGSATGQDDEQPVHLAHVDVFAVAVYPVTRGEYAAFLQDTAHAQPRDWELATFDGDDRPVVGVSWHDAVAYCAWRGDAARLPTEAEWERAARGGIEGAAFPWGDAMPDWIPEGGRGPLEGPWPVTRGVPNAFGLFGIAANVHEWCADWHARDYYASSPAVNPAGPASGIRRASRGGSWRHAVTISRCAARSKLDPSFRYTDYGFRVARSLAARGERLAAFDRRAVPSPPYRAQDARRGSRAGPVAPRSGTPGLLDRHVLPAGRLARPGATPAFHHGLPDPQ